MSIFRRQPKSNPDVELPVAQVEYPNGFASVADFIVQDKDKTSTVFRRFDRLAVRNLLYLQSRLQGLEALQNELDNEDLHSTDLCTKKAAISWEAFESLAKTREPERKRMEFAQELEQVMKRYHEALLLHSQIVKLQAPSKGILRAFRHWFKPAPSKERLRGHSRRILDDDSDLLALRVPVGSRSFDLADSRILSMAFHEQIEAPTERIARISEQKIARFVAIISTLLAATLLIGAIAALSYIQSQYQRMIVVGLFTMVFAASVSLLSQASRAEIFAATAAYAAVLVAFVSGSGSIGKS